jgi:hypothetical protein
LTQYKGASKKTFGVRGLFALLSLLSTQGHAISGNGMRYGYSRNAPLTKAPDKRRQWLRARVSKSSVTSASTSSLKQKARSLLMWNCLSHPITTSLRSCFRTKLRSLSILIRVSRLLQSLSVGSLAATGHSNDGDLSSASNDLANTNTTPAFSGRVFLSGLARGSPEEYGGVHPAGCGGAL